ncbi:BCL2 associated agonist of cell death b isoform X2 [Scomber japonicus]|uniref:BCL2 associated agonist of cell death b isoform X2 n=1 Tax=Scomber japonicus TaxID=13676 RepID=UPI0023066544|nr:BCL2 associated agonist of cell death b isoform X2 [Scomber japonicus]
MAAKFTISDNESEPEEEVEEGDNSQSSSEQAQRVTLGHNLTLPELRMPGRMRLNSESHASTVSRDEDLQARGDDEAGTPNEGAPFREMKKAKNAGPTRQMPHSKSWWSYLFSHQETEGENNHHENHTHRTE